MISEGLEFCDDVEGSPSTSPLELLGYPIDSGSPRLWSHVGRAPSPAIDVRISRSASPQQVAFFRVRRYTSGAINRAPKASVDTARPVRIYCSGTPVWGRRPAKVRDGDDPAMWIASRLPSRSYS
jgi:hypothetical protein